MKYYPYCFDEIDNKKYPYAKDGAGISPGQQMPLTLYQARIVMRYIKQQCWAEWQKECIKIDVYEN